MGDIGTIILVVVLFGSPVALIVATILWRRAVKAQVKAEVVLAELEPTTAARIEAARAETADEIQRLKARLPDLLELDAEKERISNDIEALRLMRINLQDDYRQKKEIYDSLAREIAAL